MEETVLQDIKSAIERSGFPLEHYIGLVLKQHGWQIITNRNYIDDVKGVEREIDILAYKIHPDKTENIEYITTLIISCKKNDKQKWCLLSRDIDTNDCNINFTPFHYCTSDERLSYMTMHHLDTVIDRYKKHRAVKCLYTFNNMVFAYQQLAEAPTDNERKQKGTFYPVKNEDIYNSISTTIKAMCNEKKSRLEAYDYVEKQRYYTFHAISVFEGEMYNAHFDAEGGVDVKPITNIKYLNRHIVDNVDDFYIVHFINKDIFDYRLKIFDYLHEENARTLPRLVPLFYDDIFREKGKTDIFRNQCTRELGETIQLYVESGDTITPSHIPKVDYVLIPNMLGIYVMDDFYDNDALLEHLNNNEELKKDIKEILYHYYRYSGNFKITNGYRLF